MKRLNNKATWLSSLGILAFALGCGHPMTLDSMTINPASASINALGAPIPVQYTDYGTYSHPKKTVDLSTQVTWTSSTPDVATVSSAGLVTPVGVACGTTLITATAGKNLVGPGNSDEVMTATSTFTVTDPNVAGCH